MVIYPPNNSRSTFDQPKWASQTTTEQQTTQYETVSPAEKYTYNAGEMDNNTYDTAREISDSDIETARDKAQVKFIIANTDSICAWRKLAQSQ